MVELPSFFLPEIAPVELAGVECRRLGRHGDRSVADRDQTYQ
jgi:hypothetical protein